VRGEADTYYTVQLAISAIKSHRSECTELGPVKLEVTVRGRALVLGTTQFQCTDKRFAGMSNMQDMRPFPIATRQ
jgi:hypothetical protein